MKELTSDLPIERIREAYMDALRAGHVVVAAATGSGKSTRLPVWATALGPVLVIEPRRLAATSLAAFVAMQRGVTLGNEIGHAVRGDARYRDDSGIVFVTPGVALRWFAGGALDRFATVLVDEFHERRWDTDLVLALLRQRAGTVRLVVTSATIDTARIAGYLGARAIEAPGRSYPVELAHIAEDFRQMPGVQDLTPRVVMAVRRALGESSGDVLVFLPGRREIRDVAAALAGMDADVIALHASAPRSEQRRALTAGDARRVVLATNVAETSLTVPGVTAVVDSGLERRTIRRNGRTVLALQAVARSSADQRQGRAGRTKPGMCLRLWGELAPLQRVTPPEVVREDLTELVLAAGCAQRPAEMLEFLDTLPESALASAVSRLAGIGALDGDGCATARGQRLFTLPVDAWLAHLVVAMPDRASGGFMADLVAAIANGGSLVTVSRDSDDRARLEHALGRRCDATLYVAVLRGMELPGVSVVERDRRETRRLAEQLREAMALPAMPGALDVVPEAVMAAAAQALPEIVFVRRERRREALGNGLGEVLIAEQSLLGERDEAALVLADHSIPGRRGTRQTVTIATCLAPVSLELLVDCDIAQATLATPAWDGDSLSALTRWYYAGRLVHESHIEPQGETARDAIAWLVLEGRLLTPAGARLKRDIDAWSLYVALGHDSGAVPEPSSWLVARLTALGVEMGADIALIEPGDLAFEGIPDWKRAAFDRTYPAEVSLTDLRLRIHYDVRRRVVTAEKVSGTRKRDPQRWELPAWSGWRVEYKRASRVVEIR